MPLYNNYFDWAINGGTVLWLVGYLSLWFCGLCILHTYCVWGKKTTMGMHTIIERVVNAHPILGDTLYFREKSSQICDELQY